MDFDLPDLYGCVYEVFTPNLTYLVHIQANLFLNTVYGIKFVLIMVLNEF